MWLSAKWLYIVRVWYRMVMTHPSGWGFCGTQPFLHTIALAWILQRLKKLCNQCCCVSLVWGRGWYRFDSPRMYELHSNQINIEIIKGQI